MPAIASRTRQFQASGMKLYAYCVTESSDAPAAALRGIGGSAVRLINVGNFSLVVSDFSGDAVPATRENALAHAAVVQSLLEHTTPLPFRFGTFIAEPQLQSFLDSRRDSLQARLALVRDCVEMNVKLIWDREWNGEPERDEHSAEGPGTAFLADKRRELLGSEARVAETKKVSSWLEQRLGEIVRETRSEANPTAKLILAAAHLVRRDAVGDYRAKLKEAEAERPELHFLVSGPWPPYSFANIDLEFKSHFGVS